jgi:hypothetical protein
MKLTPSNMTPTGDPSIFEHEGKLYHIPGSYAVKLAYLIVGIGVLGIGLGFAWPPASRILFGITTKAQVTRIVQITPGAEARVFYYRHEFPHEHDRSVMFQHFVEVENNGERKVMQLGVDSRVAPYANINDRLTVSFRPGDRYAIETWATRTWGVAILYLSIGLIFSGLGIPMFLAVGRPIEIDPEAKDASLEESGKADQQS